MNVCRGVQNLKKQILSPILTIGNFDGVHLGHQALFKKISARAKEINGASVVVTFEPHPVKVLAPEKGLPLLTTFDQKIKLIEKSEIDNVICVDFTRSFAAQSQREFIKNLLIDKINVKEVILGHDFFFGRGREGNTMSLMKMGEELGFKVDFLDPVELNGEIISSSLIRDQLREGNVKSAAKYLGRLYRLEGKVIKGFRKGSAIGFPTANIDVHDNLIPHRGVYATLIKTRRKTHTGVVNVGYNPTFKRERLSIEAHLFDFNENLYNEMVKIFFVDKIRDEVAFASAEELKLRIQKDTLIAKDLVKKGQF